MNKEIQVGDVVVTREAGHLDIGTVTAVNPAEGWLHMSRH